MNKLRILFVDDDANILSGLRRMLHRHRQRWEMEFAEGGQAALNILQTCPAQIVISDMRMPEMDGAALLDHIKSDHPETVRGILSGQAEQDQTLRVIGKTHFYLSKPCSPRSLTAAIERIERAFITLPKSEIRQRILALESVPSDPQLLEQTRKTLADQNCDITQVGEIVAADVGLSAKLLQLVCTSFLGKPRADIKVADAVTSLGREILSRLIETQGFASPLAEAQSWFPLKQFFRERRLIAELAGKIAEAETQQTDIQTASYNAGWLTGIGPLVLASIYPEQYRQVLTGLQGSKRSLAQAEQEIFDCHHADVSGFLAGVWGLPDAVINAVSSRLSNPTTDEDFSATTAVRAASALVANRLNNENETTPFLDHDSIDRIESSFSNRFAD